MLPLVYVYNVFFGPRLFGRFSEPTIYVANSLEAAGDNVLMFVAGARHFCTMISPILLAEGYRRGWYHPDVLLKIGQMVVLLYMGALLMRGVGRLMTPEYRQFCRLLTECNQQPTTSNLKQLKDYDYKMWAAPVDYQYVPTESKRQLVAPATDYTKSSNPFFRVILDGLSYCAVHTFGRRMLYPGSVSLLKTLLSSTLIENRRKLVRDKGGQRLIMRAADGNLIDTMFVDRRNNVIHPNGSILVVTFEGNAGFYETGTMVTPLEAGYSVLGWNHPGFAESTGQPYPVQEMAAVDVVMQYATKRLGFAESDIVLFAWSIGGYTATYAAMNFPQVRAFVLDATFDDLMPLAKAKMPVSWASLVHMAIREYLDLPIAAQLIRYQGPVLLFRRMRDEILILKETGTPEEQLRSNPATPLVIKLLEARYPTLMDNNTRETVEAWLYASVEDRLDIADTIDDGWCQLVLRRAAADQSPPLFPLTAGLSALSDAKRALLVTYLTRFYLNDFDSGHNTPLPAVLFRVPTHPWEGDER
uniref:AB hydrolase-1 domain-containing protein n=1 Tax=Plectus sambesii TaxID=2011161 RepID=A0A914XMQ2_9BILA